MGVATKDITADSKISMFDRRFRYQVLATAAAYILTISHGIAIGWVAPTVEILQTNASPLSFTIDVDEVGWIGSYFGIGCLIGNIFYGGLLDKIGRKWSLYLLALPHMVFWVFVYVAPSVEYLYVARFAAGLTNGGLYIVKPIYISEISHANIRGSLNSAAQFCFCFGIFLGFVLTTNLNYYLMPCIIIALPIIYLVVLLYFPETPQFLLKQGKHEAADRSYKFYNNMRADAELASPFAQKINDDFGALKSIMLESNRSSPITRGDFFNKPTMKIFLTALVLVIINQLSGSYALINYMTSIFAQSGSTLDVNLCTTLMGVVEICGTLFAASVVDRFGRRVLFLSSALIMATSMTVFAVFTQVTTAEDMVRFNWVPLALMVIISGSAAFGVVALVFTILVEILPTKIRSIGTSLCMCVMSIFIFASLYLFPFFLFNLGVAATFYSCAGVLLVCSIYLYVFLPETKGKSMDQD